MSRAFIVSRLVSPMRYMYVAGAGSASALRAACAGDNEACPSFSHRKAYLPPQRRHFHGTSFHAISQNKMASTSKQFRLLCMENPLLGKYRSRPAGLSMAAVPSLPPTASVYPAN